MPACLIGSGGSLFAAEAREKAKIEALISKVESLKDARFIRNGGDYDAKTAVKFLRGKWRSNAREIKTAADFIDKAATKSSLSGKPYVIRFKDGKEVKCAGFLKTELEKLNASKPERK